MRPGAFCEVTVPVGDARPGIVVPKLAIQSTENGYIAYVVEAGHAKSRTLALGMHTPDGAVEVTRGLTAGEQLVVRGIELLSDGAPVKVSKQTTLEAAQAEADATNVDAPPPAGSGEASATSGILKQPGSNAVAVARSVRGAMADLQKTLPCPGSLDASSCSSA